MQTEIIRINDISDLRIGMFDLGNGNFTQQMPKNRQFRSVVASLLLEEHRAVGLCPTQRVLPWGYATLAVLTKDITSGNQASAILWKEAAKRGIILPALAFCRDYERFGVAKNEAFLPTKEELNGIGLHFDKWNKILRACGVRFLEETLLSSTVNHDGFVWVQNIGKTYSHYDYQNRAYGVCPAVDIVLV